MPPMLPLALQQQAGFVDPYAADRAALQRRMAEAYPEAYSPEEQQQRITDNNRTQALGMLGQLSGDEGASNVGGLLLKNALAARAPHMTERGVGDPLTGKFSYNAAYRQERDQERMDKLDAATAAAQGRWDEGTRRSADQASLAMTLKGMGHGGGGDGGGGGGGAVKATQQGFDPSTGNRVVIDKYGRTLSIDRDGKQVPYSGPVVPNVDWEKDVTGTVGALGALDSANKMIASATKNPDAFGIRAKLYGMAPNPVKGWAGSLMGMSDEQKQAMTKIQQAAAIEIHNLYGAALSAGEQKRAETFLPNPDDDIETLMSKLTVMRDLAQTSVNRRASAVIDQAKARSSGLNDINPTNPSAQPQQPAPGPSRAPAAAAGGLTPEEQAELAQRRARRGQTGTAGGTY